MPDTLTNNRYGLFSPNGSHSRPISQLQNLLTLLNDFVEAGHKQLLLQFKNDIITKTKCLRLYHRARRQGTLSRHEVYLKNFIKQFQNNPQFQLACELHQTLLNTYEKAKTNLHELSTKTRQSPRYSMDGLVNELTPVFEQATFFQAWEETLNTITRAPQLMPEQKPQEKPVLTKQQASLAELQNTLKLAIIHNNTSAYSPWYDEKYYEAKLKILWDNHTKEFGIVDEAELASTAIQAVITEKQQAIIEKHVEAQHTLEENKARYNEPRLQKQQQKLQVDRDAALNAVAAMQPEFKRIATHKIKQAQDLKSGLAIETFREAIDEIQQKTLSEVSKNPTLFNRVATGKYHKANFLKAEGDPIQIMRAFRASFENQLESLTENTENLAAPAA